VSYLRLDLGCGSAKREGTVGLDIQPGPGVDHVLDLQSAPLPFPAGSVEYVYSSHLLEHMKDPTSLFAEISRVCRDGAKLEFWTPYAWENSAFIIDHKMFYNEDHYLHICVWFVDFWRGILKKRWLFQEIVYVVEPLVLVDLFRRKIELDFAVRYYKGVVKEFGVSIEVREDFQGPATLPRRSFAVERYGERHPLPAALPPPPDTSPEGLSSVIAWFSAPPGGRSGPRAPARGLIQKVGHYVRQRLRGGRWRRSL
jgi:SAM-dependent methyltransferase